MVTKASRTDAGEIVINGVPVPKEVAYSVALADVQSYRAKDQHLKASEVSDLARQEELRRINQRTNQIIQESHNAGDARAVDYFADTANKSTGANSFNGPIKSNGLSLPHYFWHGLTANGQDIETNISNLSIDARRLYDAFLGREGY